VSDGDLAVLRGGLPDYERPPVVEVVLGVQLRPLQLRAIDLGPLRDIWKDRYPELLVIAPEGARVQAADVVPVDFTSIDFGDPAVQFVTVPGTEQREGALIVRTASGTTLVVNEIIWNVDDRPGLGGWLFRHAGFTGHEPKIPTFVALKSIKDKPALKGQLEQWASLVGLERIIVSHGAIVSQNPSGVLRGLAASLGR